MRATGMWRGAPGAGAYLLFYVLATAVIHLPIPYTDPPLLKNDLGDLSVSPFMLVF